MSARLIIGDVRAALSTLEAASVDLVVTSPPFLGLRSYLDVDDPAKPFEIGSESTPGEFLDTLLDVVEGCRRVLAPHGSIAIELGDTYAGSGGAGGDYNAGGLRDGQPKFHGSKARADGRSISYGTGPARRPPRTLSTRPKYAGVAAEDGRRDRPADVAAGILQDRRRPGPGGRDEIAGWPLDKSACAIPELFHVALAYGFNPLTGRQTDRWRVRNFVAWCRLNPPVGADGDKFRRATSFVTVATMERDRYWDGDAVRVRGAGDTGPRRTNGPKARAADDVRMRLSLRHAHERRHPTALRLVGTPDSAVQGEPLRVLPRVPRRPACGEHVPRARLPGLRGAVAANRGTGQRSRKRHQKEPEPRRGEGLRGAFDPGSPFAERRTAGWTDCGHRDYRPGLVLDPFAGSGTTLQVATRMGREAIGIDLDADNEHLVRERVGMFLTDVRHL